MLVLSRCLGEVLKIGDDIEVTVLGVDGNQVRLGVTAPRHIAVDRAEIRARKDAGLPETHTQGKDKTPLIVKKTRPVIMRNRLYGNRSAE